MIGSRPANIVLAIGTCFLVAIFEGLDIQSMGVAAPRLAPAFALGPQALGVVLSTSTFGLLIGAAIGGWLSDRVGRRAILVGAMLALAIFSLATAFARDEHQLLAARLLAGLGLGGVFPNLIAITTEIAPGRLRATALGLVYCGLPIGGAFAAWLTSIAAPGDWSIVFKAGGIGPLLVIPLVLAFVPALRTTAATFPNAASRADRLSRLFADRTAETLLLWLSYFFTLFAVYLLLNWLPSMMVGKGLAESQAAQAAIVLNLGAVVGSIILGRAVDAGKSAITLLVTYVGMAAAMIGLVLLSGLGLQCAVFATGFFVIGGQLILYALAPVVYPADIRGTGVGAAVAAGRAGSILGPVLAGIALAQGLRPNAVPVLALPGIVIALIAALVLVRRHLPTAIQRSTAEND